MQGNCAHHIVHRGVFEYLTHATDAEALDFLPVVQDLLVEMVHTKDGAAAAIVALAGRL